MSSKVPFMPISQFEIRDINEVLNLSESNQDNHDDEEKPKVALKHYLEEGDTFSGSMDLILEGMGMEKYAEIFKSGNIGVTIFFDLNDDDLMELGITDNKDRDCILRSIKEFNPGCNSAMGDHKQISECIEDDLHMAINVVTHLTQLNKHAAYLQLHLSKQKLEDYFISTHDTALKVLKLVIDKAVTQSNRISTILFNGNFNEGNLIGTIVNVNHTDLPSNIKMRLLKTPTGERKLNKRRVILTFMTAVAIFFVGISLKKKSIFR